MSVARAGAGARDVASGELDPPVESQTTRTRPTDARVEVCLTEPAMFASCPYLNQAAAAAFLGLSERTLERFRLDGRGPKYHKLGRRVAYTREDLVAWADSRRRSSASDVPLPRDARVSARGAALRVEGPR
jgi:predicted DNA-binding transcriptional regulator AlpA